MQAIRIVLRILTEQKDNMPDTEPEMFFLYLQVLINSTLSLEVLSKDRELAPYEAKHFNTNKP